MVQKSSSLIDIRAAAPSRQVFKLLHGSAPQPASGQDGTDEPSREPFAAVQEDQLSRDGLFEARRQNHLVGAIWGQVQAGKTALVTPARLIAGEPTTTAGLLHQRLEQFLRGHQVRLAQALLAAGDDPDLQQLRAVDYWHAADLLYLVSLLGQFPTAPPASPLRFVPYRPQDHHRLLDLLERTYLDTLDCPRLNGLRDTRDVLEGYRQTSCSSIDRWFFIQDQDQDVGCLLLAEHPGQKHWEVVYMGLVPEARGQRWGLAVTRHAQWLARHSGGQRMVLGVDAANRPALAIYTAAGFVAWDRRHVLLKGL